MHQNLLWCIFDQNNSFINNCANNLQCKKFLDDPLYSTGCPLSENIMFWGLKVILKPKMLVLTGVQNIYNKSCRTNAFLQYTSGLVVKGEVSPNFYIFIIFRHGTVKILPSVADVRIWKCCNIFMPSFYTFSSDL